MATLPEAAREVSGKLRTTGFFFSPSGVLPVEFGGVADGMIAEPDSKPGADNPSGRWLAGTAGDLPGMFHRRLLESTISIFQGFAAAADGAALGTAS